MENAYKFALDIIQKYEEGQMMSMDEWTANFRVLFDRYGEPHTPYEPATPTAPSMSDEDKVWMAAVHLYANGEYYEGSVERAYSLLKEFRRQQKEREGQA